jgi:site-specific DNA-methyltransferase (adenine-specific)
MVDRYHAPGKARIAVGDMREVLAGAQDSVDAIVTDPPYGLEFMGKGWDRGVPGVEFWQACLRVLKPGGHLVAFGGSRTHHRLWCAIEDAGFEMRDMILWMYGSGFPKSLDVSKAIDKAAGAERRLLRVDRSIARKDGRRGASLGRQVGQTGAITAPTTDAAHQWEGWGTALKPAFEPILLARKPLSEPTVAANVLRWGTGAINVDGCRLGDQAKSFQDHREDKVQRSAYGKYGVSDYDGSRGRWPANLILSHAPDCHEVGTRKVKGGNDPRTASGGVKRTGIFGDRNEGMREQGGYADADGKETVEAWECVEDCPVRMLDEQSGERPVSGAAKLGGVSRYERGGSAAPGMFGATGGEPAEWPNDAGGASRFYYTAKASRFERERGVDTGAWFDPQDGDGSVQPVSGAEAVEREQDTDGLNSPRAGAGRTADQVWNAHPTVKPLSLMRWLVRLITPSGGLVLDPFCGSGSTLVAALQEGMRALGVDVDEKYCKVAWKRVQATLARRPLQEVSDGQQRQG